MGGPLLDLRADRSAPDTGLPFRETAAADRVQVAEEDAGALDRTLGWLPEGAGGGEQRVDRLRHDDHHEQNNNAIPHCETSLSVLQPTYLRLKRS